MSSSDTLYPEITVKLTGEDGNAFATLGRVQKSMREHGLSQDVIDAFQHEAMSGDYDHLLRTVMKYVNVE